MDQTNYPEFEGKYKGYDQPTDYTQQVNEHLKSNRFAGQIH